MSSTRVSASICNELRRRAEEGAESSKLAQKYDISVGTIRYHIYGECNHAVEPEPLTPPDVGLTQAECRQIRSRYASGEEVDYIAESMGHTWKTTVRHLSGACHHEEDDLVVEKREILKRMPISEEDCASLRRSYIDEGEPDLLSLSKNVPWTYQTVLRHVNGQCNHVVNVPARAIGNRTAISEELCREFRERYRNNRDLTLSNLEPLTEDYEASPGSIQRHIRFRCLHDPESTLLDDIDGWKELVSEDATRQHLEEVTDTPNKQEQDTVVEGRSENHSQIAAETGVHSPDENEAVADLAAPDRVETTTSRIVRNTQLGKSLKETYQYRCQLCGDARHKTPLEHYAEVHHIKPLGRPHGGPDIRSNMLVLCPNHHADFDYGIVHVDPETLEVTHATDAEISGRELLLKDGHDINRDVLEYHNENISNL